MSIGPGDSPGTPPGCTPRRGRNHFPAPQIESGDLAASPAPAWRPVPSLDGTRPVTREPKAIAPALEAQCPRPVHKLVEGMNAGGRATKALRPSGNAYSQTKLDRKNT